MRLWPSPDELAAHAEPVDRLRRTEPQELLDLRRW